MVRDAPDISDLEEKVISFIDDNPIVGQNIKFDLGFLSQVGIEFLAVASGHQVCPLPNFYREGAAFHIACLKSVVILPGYSTLVELNEIR